MSEAGGDHHRDNAVSGGSEDREAGKVSSIDSANPLRSQSLPESAPVSPTRQSQALDGEQSLPEGSRGNDALFTGGAALQQREPRSWRALGVAGAVILVIVAVLLLIGRHARQEANPGGAGLARPSPYAASLPVTDIQMSDSASLSGGKETYLDGNVTNRGTSTVSAITVQVAFKDFTGQLETKETMPVYLIRSREPYVDTEPVGAEPIKPGESRQFRLTFDATPASWDGAYPEVRVIAVGLR